MAHKNWCGNPCRQCEDPCGLAYLFPCPADCENLQPDGSREEESCAARSCPNAVRKVGGIFYTVREMMEENQDIVKLAEQFRSYEVGDWKNIQSTQAIRKHVSDLISRGVRVSKVIQALEEVPCSSGIWETNLETTLTAPKPIQTQAELLQAVKITDLDQKTYKVRNAAVRELVFQEIQTYRERIQGKDPEEIYNDSYNIEVMESLREIICESTECVFGDAEPRFTPEELRRLEELLTARVFLEAVRTRASWTDELDCHSAYDVNTIIEKVLLNQ